MSAVVAKENYVNLPCSCNDAAETPAKTRLCGTSASDEGLAGSMSGFIKFDRHTLYDLIPFSKSGATLLCYLVVEIM